jgi:dipeptidyl-peptidase 4
MTNVFWIVSVLCLSWNVTAAYSDITSEQQSALTELAVTADYANGAPEMVKPSPDGAYIYFLRSAPRDRILNLYQFTVATGDTREMLDAYTLTNAPSRKYSAAEQAERERRRDTRFGLTSFAISKDGTELLVPFMGKLYIVRPADNKLISFAGDGFMDPALSPDGKSIAAVQNNDVEVIDILTGRIRRLTYGGTSTVTHGISDFVEQEELGRFMGFWWSPDSSHIAYERADSSRVSLLQIADPAQPDQQPEAFRYPMAGTANAAVTLGIVPASGGATIWVHYDSTTFPYLARVIWHEQRAPLTIVVLTRDQRHEEVLAVSSKDGSAKVLINEFSPRWIDTDPDFDNSLADTVPAWLSDGTAFVWLTQRRGDWQLELHNRTGGYIRSLSPIGLHVRALDDVDAGSSTATFAADPDARQCQIYRVSLSGGICTPITHVPGVHRAIFSDNHCIYADSFALADGEVGTDVFSSVNGFRLARLPSVADEPATLPNVTFIRVGDAPQYDVAIIHPQVERKDVQYPVLLDVYGGPGVNMVTTAVRNYLDLQWYADLGFIVVCIDGRGTPDRGTGWEQVTKDDLIDLPLNDQVVALQDAAKTDPQMDLSLVAVMGDSFGGYFAAMAAIRRPDVFACGVAISPVTDWKLYDTCYTERYLDLPQADPTGYKTCSVLSYAPSSQRPLLIIHGVADDNVYFANSLRLAEVLFENGKSFDFLPMSGTHTLDGGDPVQSVALHTRIVQFLQDHLQP